MNDLYKFKEPTIEMKSSLEEYRRAFQERNEPLYGGSKLSKLDTIEDWLYYLESCEDPTKALYYRRVPQKVYVLCDLNTSRILGLLHCRFGDNERIRTIGGPVGYSVHPLERRKGWGEVLVKKAITLFKLLRYPSIYITCMKSNHASRILIEKCGGLLEEEVRVPEFNEPVLRYTIFTNND